MVSIAQTKARRTLEAERSAVGQVLAHAVDPVIVELGAHLGEEHKVFRAMLRDRPFLHIMVEPDPRNVRQIAVEPNCRVIEAAVAAAPGIREFHCAINHKAKIRASGSLLEPTGHTRRYPEVEFDGTALVACATLDEIFAVESLSKIDLLWVDIQGAEREMIQGGQRALAHTHYCFMETETVEMYAGEALKPELISLMPGWKVVGDFGVNILLENGNFTH